MKRLLFISILISFIAVVNAQDDKDKLEDGKWYLKGVTGLSLSQTSLSNWAAGGESSVSGSAYVNGTLTRKSGNWLWANALALEYGLTNSSTQGTRKVGDNIDFTTQLGYSTNNKWFYTVMGDFKSQIGKGYNYTKDGEKGNYISRFMAPGYSNISLGIEYRPNTIYSIYFSPAAGKLTFVQDKYLSDLGSFGVDPGDKFKAEFGTYLKGRFQKKIMENVELISTADLFTAYDKSFGNIDINWDVLLSMKINKFLSATINTTLKYDDDIQSVKLEDDGTEIKRGPRVQFKEMLGIGLAYNF